MRVAFVVAMALREGRASRRRLGVYMAAITLGVAALVAINGFRNDIARAVRAESRNLLGADLELRSRQPFPDGLRHVLDSTAAAGTPVAYVTSFASMALAPASGLTRLVEVRAVTPGFPFYGAIETDPPDDWSRLHQGRRALVDPALLVQLDARAGDTLRLGEGHFIIAGVLTRVPGEVSLRAAVGPRVYIPSAHLGETGLLGFGSRARYAAYLALPDPNELREFVTAHERLFDDARVRYDTAAEREAELSESFDMLARYLALVGLLALLLGGVGVASAVHVFVRDRLPTVAILRCLGAEQRTVFAVYLAQAATLALVGSAAGVVLGLGVQLALPGFLDPLLPVHVTPGASAGTALAGLGLGVWVALIFGLLPLLAVRDVPPLAALRREFEGRVRTPVAPRAIATCALLASILLVSVWQAPTTPAGVSFAGGLVAAAAALWLMGWLLTRLARRFLPAAAPYVARQGVANLFRPRNQTIPVTLAVGFGIFLLGTLHVVQGNLLDQLGRDTRPDRPNLVLFDLQGDQREGVETMLVTRGFPLLQVTPIVPARIRSVDGRTVEQLLADSAAGLRNRWPFTREYRNTYRDTIVGSEQVVAGWWHGGRQEGHGAPVARISLEHDIAEELGVGLGDHITWDVQGVPVESEITSLRRVNWARFEPNFFVVFESGVLEGAPQSYVVLTRAEDVAARAALQRDLVDRYPNLVALDLTLIQEMLDTVLGSIALAIRTIALFSLAAGALVLVGAVTTSRFQRLRESALLKTLGARGRQVAQVLATEYLALGILAGLVGAVLAAVAGWALVTLLFGLTFRLPALNLAGFGLAAAALTAAVGLGASREVFRKPPLAVLRELGE